MMASISELIGTQPILALFLVIGLGYAVGQIRIWDFSLGVGAVLFVGLFIGAIAPKLQIAGPLGLVGLIMFLYAIGILYGQQFFEGLSGPGRVYNVLAAGAVTAGLLVALGLGAVFQVKVGHTLGIFAGSMVSTAALQAAIDTIENRDPSIGYSVTYPFGVIGPILCLYFMTRRVKPVFPPRPVRFHMGEVTVERLPASGTTVGAVMAILPDGVQIAGVRQEHRNLLPDADLELHPGDALLIAADRAVAVDEVATALGYVDRGRLAKDRADLTYQRFFVSKAALTGVKLAELPLPADVPIRILHVRRYDMDLLASPDLMLELGDRVGLLVAPDDVARARAHFGDTLKATADFSYVSAGLGMVLGVLLGLIPVPVPGVGTVALGIGGGPLIVALILGRLRRTGRLSWVMPLPANIVLRNLGLTLFLATVGINSGQAFVATVVQTGPLMLLIGVAVLLTTVAIVLLVGFYLLGIPYDDLLGVASGATGNPAILAYSAHTAPTERPDICYAMIFPSMTIVKVFSVQIIGLIFTGG
ncbi:aspartate:alanine exchanger family transporter [Methylorubrum zatmanii]|uniref:Aspartate:alanine exchanger family transporter n=1 Tax=Methylorubrum zatmanii TaxID=29429 RepID=A0ABW1WV34_9HYPH|nr:TrkA C-terminal domain-containing protein [Methylorubrum zatmanii]MBD8905604.1 YidE/YbjL duplication [Methylorubrum zatmanii]